MRHEKFLTKLLLLKLIKIIIDQTRISVITKHCEDFEVLGDLKSEVSDEINFGFNNSMIFLKRWFKTLKKKQDSTVSIYQTK